MLYIATIQLIMSFVYTQLNNQTVLFQKIQFNVSHFFAQSLNVKQFYFTHRALSGATTPGQRGPDSDGNEVALCIPQNSSIKRPSPSDSYPSADIQSVHSTIPWENW